MASPQIVYSSTGPILLAIRTELARLTGLSTDVIKVVGDMNPPRFQATQVLQLWPQDITINEACDTGAGRFALRITEPLWVNVMTQLSTDVIDEALQAFTDTDLGHFALRSKVFGLHDFFPLDDDGNALTVEPVKLRTGTRADKPREFKGWATSVVLFSVLYRQLLTPQSDP